ncbi:FMN-dependent dehydrogenase-domain-containing protein [Vararia minispora EC-137]|uniref:FMN-dependent dehydrogenase-domain-containing protein n=1 Tax=Vararia minispora EC-137 TaxID=1314806 RepID=A0ACB8QG81_9AGAM|nr:FMN-dependent dehydrogenase-domain-containing protein [Vararia minispora EC-137]
MPLTLDDVASHNSFKSCWVIIKNKVYDLTEFLPEHPGGQKVILQYAGRDATHAYEPIHPPGILERMLPAERHLGEITEEARRGLNLDGKGKKMTVDEERVQRAQANKLPIDRMLNLHDLERVARQVLPYKALAYWSAAADDEITYAENSRAFGRFFFHPRVLRAVSQCDPATTILGYRTSIPVFVSGASWAKLGHPLGEINITRGAYATGIIQMISFYASLSSRQIADARGSPDQTLFFQLYKHKDDILAAQRIREVESQGYKAIFLTVDALVAGNRERDNRALFEMEDMERAASDNLATKSGTRSNAAAMVAGGGTAGFYLAGDDRDMTWGKTIPWLRGVTNLPLVIKGIQCVEDAVLAVEAGVDGILLSNHGGNSPPPIEVLYKLRKQRPDVFSKLEVYIDGGIRRGTDVLKALCLGARAVGLGRPFLYAQAAYGEEGVVKTVRIIEREVITGMRLLGAATVSDLVPEMVERVDWQAGTKL